MLPVCITGPPARNSYPRIRRGVFKSVDELIEAIDQYLQTDNCDIKPIVWIATAELITHHTGTK